MSSLPPLTPLAAAALHVGTPERVLQVACGDGEGALFLAREFPTARVRGIDADPDLVATASRRVGLDPEGRVAFKLGGPRKIPYPDDQFDLVAAVDARRPAGRRRAPARAAGFSAAVCARAASSSWMKTARVKALSRFSAWPE
jgi:cyclopropane fatty-acyl-phospholipid synthase-like methyltransferase